MLQSVGMLQPLSSANAHVTNMVALNEYYGRLSETSIIYSTCFTLFSVVQFKAVKGILMFRYCVQTLDKALRHKVKREELTAIGC